MNKPEITKILIGAAARSGYSMRSLAKVVGIKYPTLNRRLADPGGWRLFEIKAICRHIDFMPDEAKVIRKEVGLD